MKSKTFTNGYARGTIEQLLSAIPGMQQKAKAFAVKAPVQNISSVVIEPLNLNNVNRTDVKMQDYDEKAEERLSLMNKVKLWIFAGNINEAKAMLANAAYSPENIEKIIQDVYNQQVPILKNALKEAQQELEKAKKERTVNKNTDYGRRHKEFNISKHQNSVSKAQKTLYTVRIQYPQGRVEMYLEALDKLDVLQNANAKLQANIVTRILNSSTIAQSNEDISRHGTHINNIINKEKETDKNYTNLQDAARERFMKKREEAEIQQQTKGGHMR